MWPYALIAALVIVAVAMQVWYLQTYAAQATNATKVVVYINVGLLVSVLAVIAWFVFRGKGS